jgi:hypothetical protein
LQEKVEEVEIYETIKKVEEELAKKENVEALLARIRFAKVRILLRPQSKLELLIGSHLGHARGSPKHGKASLQGSRPCQR